jgi:hypothetical protein
MNKWVPFEQRLPTRSDANDKGEIELAETNGGRRVGQWDWIPPGRPNAATLWRANGFSAWSKLT